jgi:8-amino-7-oxononanoate synthase
MDGDFAPFPELVKLRRKYGFLLVIDDVSILSPLKYDFTDLGANRILFAFCFFKAHGTLVCGENGGGAAELFDCENDIDISVGTLSKAAGCQGGFIACR